MKKYSLLVIGWNVYIGHVTEFIRNLKKTNPNVEISLLTSKSSLAEIPEDIIKNTSEIMCFKYYSGRIKCRVLAEFVNRLYFFWVFIRVSRKRYDIVDIHYAKPRLAYVMHWIRKMSNNILISPWGSDVMRVDDERLVQQLRKVYSQTKFFTVSKSSSVGQCLVTKYNVDPNKLAGLGWGGEFFDFIRENPNRVTTEDAKARFGLSNRYVITCGYNTQLAQRHIDIIEAIYGVRDQLPENLTILLPFTYGKTTFNDRYTEIVKKKCRELGLDAIAIEEHLDMLGLLKLRMATDMFVHVQSTDAGSRSVMEYVLCNKKVVHGSWVKYDYLENYRPSCYFPVERMEDLGKCIVEAYQAQVTDLPQEVMDIIMERGWKKKMVLWNDFFESLVKD